MLLKKIKDFLRGIPEAEMTKTIDHPVIGRLILNDDWTLWESKIIFQNHELNIAVGGEREPDPVLLQYSSDIIQNLEQFNSNVQSFLEKQANEMQFKKYYGEEILKLKITDINLFWPKKPHEAMIGLGEGNDGRLWRCAYSKGSFSDLGFDD